MNKKALKQTILIVLGILVAVFIGLLVLGSLLPDEKEPTNEPYKKFNCDSNKINIYAEEYENPNMGTKFESAWVNGHDITKSIEAPDGFSLDEVDVICSKDYFILKTGYMRWPSGNASSSSFVIFDYNGNKLFAPEAEKNQKLRDKDFTLSPTNDVKESNNVITYTIAYDQREGGELVLFGITSGERLTCEEYNELKDTLIVSKTYQIEYLGNGKVSNKKLISQNFLIDDKNPYNGELVDYTPEGCKNTTINKIEDLRLGLANMAGGRVDKNTSDSDMKLFTDTLLWYASNIEAEYLVYQYLNSFGTCIDKEVIKQASKRLFGIDTRINTILTKAEEVSETTNYYCFPNAAMGDVISGLKEFESDTKTNDTWTIKYKLSNPDGSNPSYKTVNYKLVDGYWTVESMN